MKFSIETTKQFKKDYKKALKQGLDIEKFASVLDMLADDKQLPIKYKDHSLQGSYKGFRECHIEPDTLLIYVKENDILLLTCIRLGSHSELF
jgi:mRNA interferase YafQ